MPDILYQERFDRVPDRVLDVEELALEIAPLRQHKLQQVALLALDMDLAKSAGVGFSQSFARRACRPVALVYRDRRLAAF